MKRKVSLILSLVLVFTLLLCACGGGAGGGDTTSIKMATGGTTGTYYSFGGVVAQTVSEKVEGLSFDVQATGASAANLRLIDTNEVQLALVQNDVMHYAYNGIDLFDGEKLENFRTMAACYAEVCQIIVNASSGIESVADLAGKRVSVGDAGSGVEFNAKQILAAYDISFDDIQKQNLSFGDSADAIKDGKIDAFFCTAGAPTSAVMDLASTNDIKVIPVDGPAAEALMAEYPFYATHVIPKDTYNGMTEDVTTLAVKATFVVNKDLAEDVVYNITKALFENKDTIAAGHAKGAELDTAYAVGSVSVPFHPGAEKYFKEIGAIQ